MDIAKSLAIAKLNADGAAWGGEAALKGYSPYIYTDFLNHIHVRSRLSGILL